MSDSLVAALFVIQILNLISAFFLLFSSVGLIYGVHTNSRHLVWPWSLSSLSPALPVWD